MATDGDADRFAVVDEQGNYFSPNQLLVLLRRHLVKNRGLTGAIVPTVATTHLLDLIAQRYGLDVIETPVGFKYIGEMMRSRDILIGGEESGGVSVKGQIPEKDGILANLLLLELIAYEGKPLSRIWADLLEELGIRLVYGRADLHLQAATIRGVMDQLTSRSFESIGGAKVIGAGREDGLKLYFEGNTWLLIRPSGTEPLLRLYFEGPSAERLDLIVADFRPQVDGILSGLTGNNGNQPHGMPKVEAHA